MEETWSSGAPQDDLQGPKSYNSVNFQPPNTPKGLEYFKKKPRNLAYRTKALSIRLPQLKYGKGLNKGLKLFGALEDMWPTCLANPSQRPVTISEVISPASQATQNKDATSNGNDHESMHIHGQNVRKFMVKKCNKAQPLTCISPGPAPDLNSSTGWEMDFCGTRSRNFINLMPSMAWNYCGELVGKETEESMCTSVPCVYIKRFYEEPWRFFQVSRKGTESSSLRFHIPLP
ncbi:hypothetical protein lerEdw1_013288 [Lerista edwardsae]|nr:hypothetical protein lerEdw1_013288 [Lerista edwardsae]